jgi:HEPN domain-containing protein
MKPPEEIKLEFTRDWVRKAENDYRIAKHLLESDEDYTYGVTFHAQQTAEKYLKAFLVWHQIEFKKTHDLAILLESAAKVAPEISETLTEVPDLTPYGVEYRYPGDYPDVTATDAEMSVQLAELVRTEIRNRLPETAMGKEEVHGTLV